ncbi:MAG: transglutaminase domain-containing protein [Salinivirgaceae bacterium]|nr:transglutaminase domain-containing protein [Salinivirgaceae bacterium]
MKKILNIFATLLIVFSSCKNEPHFLQDAEYRNTVLNDFKTVEKLASNRSEQLFTVFQKQITLEEKEALKFLYAYMPLSDIADYDGDFFLKQIRTAFATRKSMPWGASIPLDIFRHYVLAPRVNNENLDSSRLVFYNELKNRLEGMTLKEAALEVNHWCHEKVIYQSTCERTISPLGAIKSAYGRCGEESTFTVAALRSVGIPARQCYTPRWAHCDDNHAWVEVWIDGKWYYMGACEPKPKLNVAWFDEPVLRTMLVHSKAIGKYKGNEIIDTQKEKFAYMNLIGNYASTKEIFVKVLDNNNHPIKDATVEFQLYNYAEFYPLSKQKTNDLGLCSFLTGYGDLLIWVYKNNKFSYKQATVETSDTIKILLYKNPDFPFSESFNLIPPIAKKSKTIVSDYEQSLNTKQLAYEDSIRNAYVATFISQDKSYSLADELHIDKDIVWHYIKKSRGNWQNIVAYLKHTAPINKEYSLVQLKLISDKDLRDVESETIINNFKCSMTILKNVENEELFNEYIFNPRVANEMLSDSKSFLKREFTKLNISNANQLVDWIKDELKIDDELNYYKVPLTPKGVYELRVSDKFSRDIFFVLSCRSLSIPARLEPATNIPQFFDGANWADAIFETTTNTERAKGFIKLSKAKNVNIDPQYRIQFSLAKFENGRFNTLDYGWNKPLSEFNSKLSVDTGSYLLITGNRQADGSVLSKLNFFKVDHNKTTKVKIEFTEPSPEEKVLVDFKCPLFFKNTNNETFEITGEETKALIWMELNEEPSKHVLNDIQNLKTEFLNNKIKLFFIINQRNEETIKLLESLNLSKNGTILFDKNWQQLKTLKTQSNIKLGEKPSVVLIRKHKILYIHSGYAIGVGEQLIKATY